MSAVAKRDAIEHYLDNCANATQAQNEIFECVSDARQCLDTLKDEHVDNLFSDDRKDFHFFDKKNNFLKAIEEMYDAAGEIADCSSDILTFCVGDEKECLDSKEKFSQGVVKLYSNLRAIEGIFECALTELDDEETDDGMEEELKDLRGEVEKLKPLSTFVVPWEQTFSFYDPCPFRNNDVYRFIQETTQKEWLFMSVYQRHGVFMYESSIVKKLRRGLIIDNALTDIDLTENSWQVKKNFGKIVQKVIYAISFSRKNDM